MLWILPIALIFPILWYFILRIFAKGDYFTNCLTLIDKRMILFLQFENISPSSILLTTQQLYCWACSVKLLFTFLNLTVFLFWTLFVLIFYNTHEPPVEHIVGEKFFLVFSAFLLSNCHWCSYNIVCFSPELLFCCPFYFCAPILNLLFGKYQW